MNYAPQAEQSLPRTVGTTGGNHLQGTTFLDRIGGHEILSPEMWRAAFAEMIATGLLMFTLIASVIACLSSHMVEPLLVALAVFINVFLFLMVMAPISGGHLNPVISLIAALEGVVTIVRASVYIKAQCIGSILGFLLIHTLIAPEAEQKYLLGGCSLNGNGDTVGLSPVDAFLMEFVCTFLLLLMGITVAFDKKKSKELGLPWVCFMLSAPMALGVFVSITLTGKAGYGGVGLNPARCLGPLLVRGGPLWHGHWVFWLAPFLACMVYYVVFKTFPRKPLEVVEGERDILSLGGPCFGGGGPKYIQK